MEENTVQTEQAEAVETSGAFDEGWADDWGVTTEADGQAADTETTPDAGDTVEGSEGTDADADQQDAEGTDGEGEGGKTPEGEGKGDEGNPDQGDTFTLKHLGEEKSVSRDEVVALAQKGMDYDRIREKWDAVKDDIPKLRGYEKFLTTLAESRDGDIDALMDETMTQILMSRAKARGETLEASAAAAQAVRMRLTPAEPEETESTPEQGKGNADEAVTKFLAEYPQVKAEDIPKEVWEEVNRTGDLLSAYRGWENRKLSDELKTLRKDLENEKQRSKNRERSTGAPNSTGAAKARDPFDEGWDSLT